MNALELFSGSQSFRKQAEPMGLIVRSLDIKQVGKLQTEYLTDYMDFDIKSIDFKPDFIWASPDCAAYSRAAGSTHFDKGSMKPKTEKAKKSILCVEKLYNDILYELSVNPKIIFWIENPVGRMEKLPFMQDGIFQQIPNFRKVRIDQCAYGREYMKPTHIFTNDKYFVGKRCIGKDCHHARNENGRSKFMTHHFSGKGNCPLICTGYWDRAKLPENLIIEILKNHVKNETTKTIHQPTTSAVRSSKGVCLEAIPKRCYMAENKYG